MLNDYNYKPEVHSLEFIS